MFVIYESAEDKCWIAHGLRSDQIGMGDCIVEALVAYMRAIEHALRAAAEGKDVTLRRLAPPEIRALARTARLLPREVFEIAYKRLKGRWPEDLSVSAPPGSDAVFKGKVEDPVLA